MINEEKVRLMTKAALFEQKEEKDSLKTKSYFRFDYISLELLKGWFFGSIVYVLIAAIWVACHAEYLLENIQKMDLKALGKSVVTSYAVSVLFYIVILYLYYSYRYYKAHKKVSAYLGTLDEIAGIYNNEEKEADGYDRQEE